MLRHAFWLMVLVVLAACGAPDEPETVEEAEPAAEAEAPEGSGEALETGLDPHSYAEYERVKVQHLELDLDADFTARQLSGHAIVEIEREDPDVDRLVLDTWDLEIRDVLGASGDGEFEILSWRLGDAHEYLGAPLVVELPEDVDRVRIDYASSPDAFGLQWLDGAQTSSGQPFLFSQSQPHYARTWVPLQDTPAVRYTFEATLRVPPELLAVMGADGNRFERNDGGEYRFEMNEPIPSYLMAIGIGDLEFAETGPRSGVYAEPEFIEEAAWEFAELEEMIDIGEALYGPYQWGRYDLLVLPPSFPFGGMENPRLSYVTPTIIAGDRSLLTLVAHELAHSWSGNLVTNAAWRDLWLNEGFTVYFEARIMEELYGRERRDMEAVLGYQDLMNALETADDRDRQLVRDLADRDPEQAFMRTPYVMGRMFLDFLEDRFGRETFDAFLRDYFDHFAWQSITSEDFRDYLETHLIEPNPDVVTMDEVDEWLYEPGLPETAVIPESEAFDRVDDWKAAWRDGDESLEALPGEDWSVHEWLHFLNGVAGDLDTADMETLDADWDLTESENYEIAFAWLMRAIETRYEPAMDRLEAFLLEVGRNKFTQPLYASLADTDWGRDWAIEIYEQARPGYHPLTRQAAERALEIEE